MKKLLLFGLIAHLSLAGFGQKANGSELYNKVYTKRVATDNPIQGSNLYKKPNPTTATGNNKAAYEEEVLGNTYYDLQTNGSVMNRLIMDDNGNMAAVWTASTENNQNWTDRGSGYSYFNGSSWTLSPQYPRIETVRCGWPNILFPASGGEIVISHQSVVVGATTDTKLRMNSRASRGSGSWTEKLVSNTDLTWPRAAMGGADGNSIHLIAVTDAEDSAQFQGMRRALVYYRSEDGGSTFNIQDSILPGLDASAIGTMSGDNYSIIADGETVVIAVFDTWNDVFFLRSTDNGDTWTKQIAYNNPIAGVDIVTDLVLDTVDAPDGSGNVILDQNGDVHMFWSWISVFNDVLEPADQAQYSYFGFREGLLHWTENNAPNQIDTIAFVVDQDNNGTITLAGFGPYGTSLTSMPSSGLAADGKIYVSYAGIHELLDDGDADPDNYRHLYIIVSEDNGDTWSEPVDLNPNDEFTENVFCSMNMEVGAEYIDILFQRDSDPGCATTDGQPTTDNEIVYAKVSRLLNVGVEIHEEVITGLNVYPNPAENMVTINFELKKPGQVSASIVSITGQKVFETQQQVNTSRQNKVQVDVSDFPAGIYFVNVVHGDGKTATQKFIVK